MNLVRAVLPEPYFFNRLVVGLSEACVIHFYKGITNSLTHFAQFRKISSGY